MYLYNFIMAHDTESKVTKEQKDKIIQSLERRMSWLEVREPDSDGDTYDNWQEQIDLFEECKDSVSEEYNAVIEYIKDIQNLYGGLKRWKI